MTTITRSQSAPSRISVSAQPALPPEEVSIEATKVGSVAKAVMTHKAPVTGAFGRSPETDAQRTFQIYWQEPSGKMTESNIVKQGGAEGQKFQEAVQDLWTQAHSLTQVFNLGPGTKNVSVCIGRMQFGANGKQISQGDIYDKIKELVRTHYKDADCIAINIEDMSVRFLQNGELKRLEPDEIKEVKQILTYFKTWQNAHEIAMNLLGIKDGEWHTRYNKDVNRSSSGRALFQVNHYALQNHLPKTHEEFLAGGFFDSLAAQLPDAAQQQKARKKIGQTHKFVSQLEEKLAKAIEERKNWPKLPHNEIEDLEFVRDQLRDFKCYPVYRALAFIDTDKPITADTLRIASQVAKGKQSEAFKAERSLNPDKLNLDPRVLYYGKVNQDELDDYALDEMGLFFHNELDFMAHPDACSSSKSPRPCVEEFVMNNMIHANTQGYVDDLRSFNRPTMNPRTQQLLRDLINEARTQAFTTT